MSAGSRRAIAAGVTALVWIALEGQDRISTDKLAIKNVSGSPALILPKALRDPQTHSVLTLFDEDQKWFSISRASSDYKQSRILVYRMEEGGGWRMQGSTPFLEEEYESGLTSSNDGSLSAFTSSRPTGQAGANDRWNLFTVSVRPGGSFGVVRPFPFNSNHGECCMAFADDDTVYFASDRGGDWDIYSAKFSDGEFSDPRPAGGDLNSKHGEWPSYLYPGGDSMLLSSIRPGGPGGDDLWIARRCEGRWSAPARLPEPYNTPQYEDNAIVIADGILVWSSKRRDLIEQPRADVVGARYDPRNLLRCPEEDSTEP